MEIVTVILAVAGFISAVCAAGNWLVKLVQALKAPNVKQDRDIAELQEWRKGVDEKLDSDNRRLKAISESDRITQRALLALLAHGIDGVSSAELLAWMKKQPEVRYCYAINSTNVHFDIPKGRR